MNNWLKSDLDLKDAEGYLDAIGQEQTANIKSKAAIEKAEADRDAFIQEQECQKNAMDKKYQVDTSIADFEKEFKTKEVRVVKWTVYLTNSGRVSHWREYKEGRSRFGIWATGFETTAIDRFGEIERRFR